LKNLAIALTLLIVPLPAFAGEKVQGTNYLVVERQTWPTGESSGYWMYQGKGVQQTLEGAPDTGPVECVGSGYWDQDGSWGEGICVFGSGANTRVTSWKQDKGRNAGTWTILSGTGTYAGMTGEGSYVTTTLPEGRSMSEWEGEIESAN
jgi:hypothetical protein